MTTPDPQKTSIALNYNGSGAPVISASGTGLIAEEILDRAKQAGVPVHGTITLPIAHRNETGKYPAKGR